MESFKFKPELELQEQVQKTEETLNYGHEDLTSLLPDGEAVFSMSKEELSKKYTRRYLTYVELLRKTRSGESVDEGEFEKEYQIIKALNNLKEYIQTHKEGGTEKFALRERQIETLQKISDWLEAGGTKGHIVMPTGCGKTVIFLALVEAVGLKTFICEPTQIIQDQVITEIQEKTEMEDVAKRNTQKRDISKRVVVTTYQSLLNDVKNARLGENEVDLFIRDEAHKSLGENTSASLDLVGGIQIGFTATEDYEYKSVADQLPDCIDELDPIEAIRLKMISGYKNWVIGTDISLNGVKFDGSKEDDVLLEKAVDITKRNMVAVDIYKNAFQANNSRGVCFCYGIIHSKNVAELFNSGGITARHIDGDTPINERKEILAAYKRGEISILTCSDVLIEGFDEKQVDVIFNLAPSQSKVRVMQRGGRALRQDENRETPKVAHIFDFEDKDSKAIPYGYYLETDDTSTLALENEQRFPEKEEKARKDYESVREQIMNISKGLQTALEGTGNIIYDKDLYNEYLGRMDERFEKREITLSVDELQTFCRQYEITSRRQYESFVQNLENKEITLGWPYFLDGFLRKKGISLTAFFDKESKEVITVTVNDLKELCKKYEIKTGEQYNLFIKGNNNALITKGWPKALHHFLKKNGITKIEFFDRTIDITVDDLKELCKRYNLKSRDQYNLFKNDPNNATLIKGWPRTLESFLKINGVESKSFFDRTIDIPVDDLKELCKKYGIQSKRQYHEFIKKPANSEVTSRWPGDIVTFAKKHDHSIADFFDKEGRKKITITPGELKTLCQRYNITNKTQYYEFRKSNQNLVKGWPGNLDYYFKQRDLDSSRFFGNEDND